MVVFVKTAIAAPFTSSDAALKESRRRDPRPIPKPPGHSFVVRHFVGMHKMGTGVLLWTTTVTPTICWSKHQI